MYFTLTSLFFYSLSISNLVSATEISNRKVGLLNKFEDKLENGVRDTVNYFTRKLENFNDENLGDSILGPQYKFLKTKLQIDETARPGRKIHGAMLPLVFQVGATSTWLLLTALLTAKSVAIGLILLVFKIAVSTAKVSAFFTAWKQKHHHDHHDHHSYHGDYRSLNIVSDDHSSYFPHWHNKEDHSSLNWDNSNQYKTIPSTFNTQEEIQPGFKSSYDIADTAALLKNGYESSGTKNTYGSSATSYNPSGEDVNYKSLPHGYGVSEETEPSGGYEYADDEDLNDITNSNEVRKSRGTEALRTNTDGKTINKANEAASVNGVSSCVNCKWHAPLALKN